MSLLDAAACEDSLKFVMTVCVEVFVDESAMRQSVRSSPWLDSAARADHEQALATIMLIVVTVSDRSYCALCATFVELLRSSKEQNVYKTGTPPGMHAGGKPMTNIETQLIFPATPKQGKHNVRGKTIANSLDAEIPRLALGAWLPVHAGFHPELAATKYVVESITGPYLGTTEKNPDGAYVTVYTLTHVHW